MASQNVVEITQSNFEQEVTKSDKPVLVDFWAAWCGPCRMIGPIVDQIAGEYADQLKVGKVNVDNEGALAAQFGVMSIPTLMLFKDGKLADKTMGAVPKPTLESFIKKVL